MLGKYGQVKSWDAKKEPKVSIRHFLPFYIYLVFSYKASPENLELLLCVGVPGPCGGGRGGDGGGRQGRPSRPQAESSQG